MASNIRPTLHHDRLQGVNDAAFSQIWVLWHLGGNTGAEWIHLTSRIRLQMWSVPLNCIHRAYVEMCGGDVTSLKYVATTASYFKPRKNVIFFSCGRKRHISKCKKKKKEKLNKQENGGYCVYHVMGDRSDPLKASTQRHAQGRTGLVLDALKLFSAPCYQLLHISLSAAKRNLRNSSTEDL